MSGYVGKFFTAVSAALEFNTATLSGAIDIVVIEDDQGRRHCSPFHVRFGKLQLLKSRGIPVDIELNGQRTGLRMLLGAAGEAYFYDPKYGQKHTGDKKHPDNHPSSPAVLAEELRAEAEKLDIPSISYPPSESDAVSALLNSPSMHSATKPPFSFVSNPSGSGELPMTKSDRRGIKKPSDSWSNLASHVVETTTSDYPFGYISDSEVELTRRERAGTTEVVDEPRSPPILPSQRKWSYTVAQKPPTAHLSELSDESPEKKSTAPVSISDEGGDTSEDHHSALFGLPAPPPSRHSKEIDGSHAEKGKQGKSPTSPQDESFKEEGDQKIEHKKERSELDQTTRSPKMQESLTVSVSISDIVGEEEGKLDCRSVDGYEADEDDVRDLQEQVAYVLSRPKSLPVGRRPSKISPPLVPPVGKMTRQRQDSPGIGIEHDKEYSLLQEGLMSMSLCGSLLSDDMDEAQIMELFQRHQISFEEFIASPNTLHDPSLLFRIDNRLVELRVAVPFIFAALSFNKKLDIDLLAKLTAPTSQEEDEAPKSPPTPSRRFTWFGWASPTVVGEPLLQGEDLNVLDTANEANRKEIPVSEYPPRSQAIPVSTDSNENSVGKKQQDNGVPDNTNIGTESVTKAAEHENKEIEDGGLTEVADNATDGPDARATDPGSSNEPIPEEPVLASVSFADLDPDSLSLRPTPEELKQLDLKPGANTVRFYVESSDVELNCRVFLWSCHTKIVISDVDGTITRSDVLGHLLPAVGRDWSQVGVAGLYSQIEKNGYKMLYLTARPIGQASQTRAFLHSVTQGSAKLPNGPVLMSPNRLVESFTREVIRRKPQEFKIAALREIRCLFSPDYNPFHAGFGNRDTDVISYRAVGLIPQRIFVVNPRGELVVMKAKYESAATYSTLQDLVESVFPDISGHAGLKKIQALMESATFNDWNYWKESLPELDFDHLLDPT